MPGVGQESLRLEQWQLSQHPQIFGEVFCFSYRTQYWSYELQIRRFAQYDTNTRDEGTETVNNNIDFPPWWPWPQPLWSAQHWTPLQTTVLLMSHLQQVLTSKSGMITAILLPTTKHLHRPVVKTTESVSKSHLQQGMPSKSKQDTNPRTLLPVRSNFHTEEASELL